MTPYIDIGVHEEPCEHLPLVLYSSKETPIDLSLLSNHHYRREEEEEGGIGFRDSVDDDGDDAFLLLIGLFSVFLCDVVNVLYCLSCGERLLLVCSLSCVWVIFHYHHKPTKLPS
jgi:hypothetical protein